MTTLSGKNIIVTGGAGFIGSTLVDRLCTNNKILVVDNMHTGSIGNLSKAMKSGNVTLKRSSSADISKPRFDADIVYHLGMYSSTPMYKKDPRLLGKVASDMINVLEYVREHRVPLVFASTSSIYNGVKPPHREDAQYKVTDYYTEGRIFAERASELYGLLYDSDIAAMRFFSVYGPKERAKREYANLISQFMWLMEKGHRPVIYGDGTQKRDFIHVDDVVEALVRAHAVKGFKVYNVGTGSSHTVNSMVGVLNEKLGTAIKPKYIKMPISNYVRETLADTSKAKRELGFSARIPLDKGISMLTGSKSAGRRQGDPNSHTLLKRTTKPIIT
jgi:UDP-glucose 4-epimerase